MPNSDKDNRTPEEREERRHKAYAKRVRVRERGKIKDKRERRLHAERAERIRLREKGKRVVVREKQLAKERIKRRHKKGRYDWEKLSPKKQAALAALEPWNT